MKGTLLLLILFFSFSCSSYFKRFESEVKDGSKKVLKQTYCPAIDQNKFQFLSNHAPAINEYTQIIEEIAKNHRLNFEEVSVLWTLSQFYIRPLSTTPHSRIQFFYNLDHENFYYDSGIHKEERDIFSTLELFLGNTKSRRSVSQLIGLLENNFPKQILVDSLLSRGLDRFSANVEEAEEKITPHFIKGGQILRENESYNRTSYNWFKGHKNSYPLKNRENTGHLFSRQSSEDSFESCSFDINIYDNSLFPVVKNAQIFRHVFGLTYKNKSFFAVTGQEFSSLDTPTPMSSGSIAPPAAICLLKNKENSIIAISRYGRDPGQHLYHLYKYGLSKSQSIRELDEYLKFPRHLLLFNPNRIIYESKRATPEQLEEFIKLDFPLYHIDSLGEIWALSNFQQDIPRFVTDSRGEGMQTCLKQ